MANVEQWLAIPAEVRLPHGMIHVWRASLDLDVNVFERLKAHLEPAEIARAERFRFESDYKQFVSTRGILRELLGIYSGPKPADLRFCYGPQHKPALVEQASLRSLEFNVSHSHGLAVYAFARDRAVGIDLEFLRTYIDSEKIAERYFSVEEIAELRSLPINLRTEGFFLCWTRKEAYVKAQGAGLEIPLANFSVTLTPGKPERLTCVTDGQWSLRSFRPARDFVGAVVGEGDGWEMCCWEWKP